MHALAHEAPPPLTRSVEDYLKVIYHLSNQGGFAATSEIAAMLDLAPPSVSGMVKRLSEAGLIEHVPYRGVQLTAQGRRARQPALRSARRADSHRRGGHRGSGAGAPVGSGRGADAGAPGSGDPGPGAAVLLRGAATGARCAPRGDRPPAVQRTDDGAAGALEPAPRR